MFHGDMARACRLTLAALLLSAPPALAYGRVSVLAGSGQAGPRLQKDDPTASQLDSPAAMVLLGGTTLLVLDHFQPKLGYRYLKVDLDRIEVSDRAACRAIAQAANPRGLARKDRLPDGSRLKPVTGQHVLIRQGRHGGTALFMGSVGTMGDRVDPTSLKGTELTYPVAVCVGVDVAVYVAERLNHRILQALNGGVTLYLGGEVGARLDRDDPLKTQLCSPTQLEPLADRSLIVLDQGNHRVLLVSPEDDLHKKLITIRDRGEQAAIQGDADTYQAAIDKLLFLWSQRVPLPSDLPAPQADPGPAHHLPDTQAYAKAPRAQRMDGMGRIPFHRHDRALDDEGKDPTVPPPRRLEAMARAPRDRHDRALDDEEKAPAAPQARRMAPMATADLDRDDEEEDPSAQPQDAEEKGPYVPRVLVRYDDEEKLALAPLTALKFPLPPDLLRLDAERLRIGLALRDLRQHHKAVFPIPKPPPPPEADPKPAQCCEGCAIQ